MSHVRITSKRTDGPRPHPVELVIVADRSDPVLGNRHVLRDPNNPSLRARVLELHRQDEEHDWERNGPITRRLREIAEVVRNGQPVAFDCWCAPLACHCERYRWRIGELLGKDVRPPDEIERERAADSLTPQQATLF